MRLIRTFHPVGQGAFYTERFDNFTMVYDCGTKKNQKRLESEINGAFFKDETIDVVFVSHLHYDHISGIEHLLKKHPVKRIFLPLLTPIDKILYLILNPNAPNKYEDFIYDPAKKIMRGKNRRTKVIFINPIKNINEGFNSKLLDIEDINQNKIDCQKIKLPGVYDWCYIPFNFQHENKRKYLSELLAEAKLDITDLTDKDIKKFWIANKTRLIAAYRDLTKDINVDSLMIYSGPCNDEHRYKSNNYFLRDTFNHQLNLINNSFGCLKHSHSHNCGILYFGDYNANNIEWRAFYSKFNSQWNSIGTVQVPHHGSADSFSSEIVIKSPLNCVISYGVDNTYGHPHIFAISNILLKGGDIIPVTEDKQSTYIQVIQKL